MTKQTRQLDFELLRSRLKLKSFQSERKLLESHSAAAKFFERFKLRPGRIRAHAANLLSSGALASTLLLSAHTGAVTATGTQIQKTIEITTPFQFHAPLVESLKNILPTEIKTLDPEQEQKISELVKKATGLTATASLEGNKLNDSYGRMGAEQHLARFPGDYVENMAPGLGGWGYVWDTEIEKYYVAVQTLYLSNWKTDTKRLSNWYKHRRVIVINPANGKIIVAAVADAGPSFWTGKKFGGSPEVMAYLGINYGRQNHPVILFFLDDPEKKISLGPIEYNVKAYDQNIL